VTSTIDVSDTALIGSLKVRVDITHSYIGDLTVELRHGGKTVVLHNRAGGGDDNLVEEYMVSDFIGESISGGWELFMADKANIDTGSLNKWSIVYAPGDGSVPPTPTDVITHENTTATQIPDNNETGIKSVINVPEGGTVKRLTVNVDITHTYIGDLLVEIHHMGTGIVLHNQTGASMDNIVKEFTLSDFNNMSVSGEWTLVISDNAGQDVGTLNSWSVKLEVE
jgi:subtilisin-like proprotein convertase family protein